MDLDQPAYLAQVWGRPLCQAAYQGTKIRQGVAPCPQVCALVQATCWVVTKIDTAVSRCHWGGLKLAWLGARLSLPFCPIPVCTVTVIGRRGREGQVQC